MRREERKEYPTSGGLELYTEMKRPSTVAAAAVGRLMGRIMGQGVALVRNRTPPDHTVGGVGTWRGGDWDRGQGIMGGPTPDNRWMLIKKYEHNTKEHIRQF